MLEEPEPILWGGELILRDSKPVGYTTSGSYGHTVGSAIAMGYVNHSTEVTPEFIRRAGIASLQRGETFYTHNLGIPELREALAEYLSRLHRPTTDQDIAVTTSGVVELPLSLPFAPFPLQGG